MVSLANAAAETRDMFLRSFWFLLMLMSATQGHPSPISDAKRYNQRNWSPVPLMYQSRSTRPYASYYDGYGQDLTPLFDLYYPQDSFDKYRYYPYYPEPIFYPEQYFIDEDEAAPEEEEPSTQQDSWSNYGNAEANALFLQNLILAQLYKDSPNKSPLHPYMYGYPKNDDYDDRYVYGEQVRQVTPTQPKEDKDVRELKSLVDNGKQRRKEADRNLLRSTKENRWVDKRQEESTTTTIKPTKAPRSDDKGQDEILMPRPATPVRATSSFHHRAYQPSVYDAIKKLLIQQENESNNRQPQKRSYVLPEDSLVEELGNLKKDI